MVKSKKIQSPKRTSPRTMSQKKSPRRDSKSSFRVGRGKYPFPMLNIQASPKNKYQNLYESLFGIQKSVVNK
jgi:hypothetical protein